MTSTYFDGVIVHIIKDSDSWGYRYLACNPKQEHGGPFIDWKIWSREGDVPTCLQCIVNQPGAKTC